MSNLKEMLLSLCLCNGTSGHETDITEAIKKYIPSGFSSETDVNGNLICTFGSGGKHFLLDAHTDRIGMTVTGIERNGFLRIAKCGGSDARVMAAQDVTIHGKRDVYGVVTSTPPHLTTAADAEKAKDFDSMLIDTGLTDDEAKKIISCGDRVTVNAPAAELKNNIICSPALDDRSGCAVLLRAAELISGAENAPTVTLLFSAQEETGGAGAVTGAYNIEAEECISVDVSFARAHDVTEERYGSLGGGPLIGVAPVLDFKMSRLLEKTAAEKNIPYQLEVMGDLTGTNADHISITAGGIKTALISVPQRNMHTGVELVSLDDVENSAQLIAQYVLGGGLNA